ncbi:DUF1697 domain-containing protein [Kineococcus sp. LSe6-4]|uniref:DUF1697 domain-containing protein n=1 Tax=Kineococcus halophytocola TaxID=3234027 RepID=A0ABV4H3L6_9ACTN
MKWVVLLRGVNVNGVTVRSAALSACLQEAGFTGVRSVLASGNVVLEADDAHSAQDVRSRVEAALRSAFGYEAWVVVLTPQRLAEVAAAYPFARDDEHVHPYVTFTSDPGRLAALAAEHLEDDAENHVENHADDDAEAVVLAGDVLYWRCPKGASTDTPFARRAGAARWKPFVTTRNLRTVGKLLAVAGGA